MSCRIETTAPIATMRGSLSKEDRFYFRTYRGRITLCRKPQRGMRRYTAEEINRWDKFKHVSKLTAEILKNPELRRYYEKQWSQSGKKNKVTLRGFIFADLYQKK